jgi:hypothetical protein
MAVTSVASTITARQLVARNGNRLGVIVVNDDANALYVLVGPGTAASTNYSFKLDEGEDAIIPGCKQELNGVWAGDGSGSARITEYE